MKDRLIDAFVAIMQPTSTVFIVGALIVLLVPILVHYILVNRSDYTVLPSILLAGPSGSGKTALAALLEHGGGTSRQDQASIVVPPTRTSIVEHSVELSYSNTGENTSNDDVNDKLNLHHGGSTHTRFILHDTPGFESRRYIALNYISNSVRTGTRPSSKLKAIVYMVDSAAMGDDTVDKSGSSATTVAAEFLHDILVALQRRTGSKSSSKAPSAVSVLIAANKQDLFTAYPAHVVKTSLEAELTRLRVSRSKGMLESGVGADDLGADDQDAWLGTYGSEKFIFEQMREFDVEVEVLGGNAVVSGGAGSGANSWWEWMINKV